MTPASALFERNVALRDGSTVLLRTVRLDDRPALTELLSGLSRSGALFRLPGAERATDTEVDQLARIDWPTSVSLVAESRGSVLGAGRYIARPGRLSVAEVSFLVADAWQGRGVGTQLLCALADVAREHGIDAFEADVLEGHHQMLQVFRDSGFTLQQHDSAGTCHLSFPLRATDVVERQSISRAQISAAASMRAFFQPDSIAVIGASRQRGKIGSEILHNLIACGFRGRLAVVHPEAAEIQNIPAYRAVAAIPHAIDLAVIAVPASSVSAVVDECITKGVKALIVITAGFSETGPSGRLIEADLLTAVRRAGIRMVGPNCMGLLNTNPDVRLNATFSPVFPPHGRVAMLSQSGALGLAILDHARRLQIGLSTFVSVGNKTDVSANDLLQYWEHDEKTDIILLYLESFGNPRKFSQIARRLSRSKPIVAVKAGRSTVGARAATSHTGALAASDTVVTALFHQCGVIRTDTMEQLFDVTRLLSQQAVPRGRRVAVVTNAGGPGILAADACAAQGLELPDLSPATVATLRNWLPTAASAANPIDLLASATANDYERALAAVLTDETIDSVVVIFIPPLVTAGEDVARAITRAAVTHADKPILSVFMGSEPAADLLRPIPAFVFPEAAVSALAHATRYGEWRRSPTGSVPAFPDIDGRALRSAVADMLARGGGWTTVAETTRLLRTIGIASARAEEVTSVDTAVAAATAIGFPVVLKAVGPAIVHKTELHAVRLNLENAEAVQTAFHELKSALGESMTGALVQELATGGVEMLVGAVEDPAFGPVVACALGGTAAELFSDGAFRLAPLTDLDARSMVDGLRCAALLRGYRGRPVADEAGLREALLRISALTALCPEIQEIDINPLLVRPQGVLALDARIRIAPPVSRPDTRRVQY